MFGYEVDRTMGPKTPTHPLDHKKGSSNTYMCDVQHSFLMYDWSCFLGGMGTTKKGMHTLCNNKDKPKNYYYFWSLNVKGEVEISKGLLRKKGGFAKPSLITIGLGNLVYLY